MMVGLSTSNLRDKESRIMKKWEANREEAWLTWLRDMIGAQKTRIVGFVYFVDARFNDKYKARFQ